MLKAFVGPVIAQAGLPACDRSCAFEFATACVTVNFRPRVEEMAVFINVTVLVLLALVTTARRSAVVEIVFGLVAVVCIAATQRHLAPATRLKNQRAEGGSSAPSRSTFVGILDDLFGGSPTPPLEVP